MQAEPSFILNMYSVHQSAGAERVIREAVVLALMVSPPCCQWSAEVHCLPSLSQQDYYDQRERQECRGQIRPVQQSCWSSWSPTILIAGPKLDWHPKHASAIQIWRARALPVYMSTQEDTRTCRGRQNSGWLAAAAGGLSEV